LFWSIFRGIGTLITRLLYLLIIVGAIAKVLTFGFALYAESHKEVIEDLASRVVGTPVHFSRIQTYWAGLTPRIWVRQLTLGKHEQLALGDALVGINLRALAHWRDNLPLNIRLEGTRIQVLRDREGKTRILGLLKHRHSVNLPAYIHLTNATLDWLDVKRDTTVHQEHLSVRLTTRGRHSSLHINSAQDGFQIRGEIEGSITRANWSGRFWSKGNALQSEKFLQAYLPEDYLLSNLQLSYELWSYWTSGSHSATRIRFNVDGLELHAADGATLDLSGLQGDLLYERRADDWKLQIADLQLQIDGRSWGNTRLALQKHQGRLGLGVSRIALGSLAPLSHLLADNSFVKLPLQQLSPTGELNNLRASASTPLLSEPAIQARFQGVSLRPSEKLPGISNFSGRISLEGQRVQLHLDTQQAEVEFKTLFREPLDISRLQGKLDWTHRPDGGWRLDGRQLLLDTPDLHTLTRLQVEQTPGQPPIMDIQTDFHDGNGRNAGRYYPVGIMKPHLVNWLDKAIVSGHVTQGSFLFHGPLAKGHFPFHKTHDGHFEVAFDVEDLELNYRKDWPPLKKVQAHVRFHNNDLDIRASQGHLYASTISQARARISSLKPPTPIQIHGLVRGPGNDPLRLLRNSPLRHSFARRIQGMALDGRIELQLDLDIPLHSRHPGEKPGVAFSAVAKLQNNKLILQRHQLAVHDIRGSLKIDNQGLHADGLQGNALGGVLGITISPEKQGMLIRANGHLPAAGIVAQYPWLRPLSLNGDADLDISLKVPGLAHPDTPTQLQIHSTLKGMSVALPAPLGKNATDSIPLKFNTELNADQPHTTVEYGNRLNLTLNNTEQGNDLFLKLPSLPLRPWLARLQEADTPGMDASVVQNLFVSIGTLEAPPLKAGKFKLNLQRQGRLWKGRLNSEALTGDLSFATDLNSRPLLLRLERLALDTLSETDQKDKAATEDTLTQVLPGNFPSLDISSESLYLNGADIGRLELHTQQEGDHQLMDRLELHGKLLDLSSQGSWETAAHGSTTWIKGTLTTDDMGKLLKKALHKEFLSGSRTYLSYDLSWPGAPFQLDTQRLQGEAQLDMARGRFLNFKPGLARILGLINFQSLGRRLKLDFKDVYKEGLAFDTILGNFQLDAGYLYTNNLEVSGPSATLLIAGSVDLINETYDQVLSVSPRLDATLPVAGAIVGGPAAGVAVLLAQQALSKKLEKAQRITYNISGTWEEPKITRLDSEQEPPPSTSVLDQ